MPTCWKASVFRYLHFYLWWFRMAYTGARNSPSLKILSQGNKPVKNKLVFTITGFCSQEGLVAFSQLCLIESKSSLWSCTGLLFSHLRKVEPKTLERHMIYSIDRLPQWLISLSEIKPSNKWFLLFLLLDPMLCSCWSQGELSATVCWKAFCSGVFCLVPGCSCSPRAWKDTRTPCILWEQLLLRGVTALFITPGFQAARLLPVQFFAGQSTLLRDFRRKVAYVLSWKISVLEGSWGKNRKIRGIVMIKNGLTDLVWFHLSPWSRKGSDWRQGQI